MLKQLRLWVLFVIIATSIFACDSATPTPSIPTDTPAPTNTLTPTPTNTPRPTAVPIFIPQSIADDPSEQVYLRLINAGTDLPPLTVNIEGLLVASDLNFGVASFPTGITAGNYAMQISSPENIIVEQSIEFEGGDNLILMFTGTEDAFNISTFDESTDPLRAGQSRVNLIHAVSRGPNITLQENGLDLTAPLDFGQISTSTTIDSGAITLTFQSGEETLYALPTTLREHINYTYILVGDFNNRDSLSLISFDNRVQGFTNIRLINAMSDVSAVDVYFGDMAIATDLAPTRFAERTDIASQAYQIGIYTSGSDPTTATPLLQQEFNALQDDILTMVLAGDPNSPQIILMEDNLTVTPVDETRIRFVNVVPEIPNVEISLVGGDEFSGLNRISYGQPSRTIEIEIGSYGFQWSRVEDNGEPGEIVEYAQDLILESGRSYLYLFTGQDSDTPLVISEEVGVSTDEIALNEELEGTPQSIGPTRIRFVHAIDSAPLINVFFDDLEIGSLLAFRATLDFTIIPSGLHIVSIREETNTQIMSGVEYEFQPDTDYSIYAYGVESYGFDILIIEDNLATSENQASVRLVNLSQEDRSQLSLRTIPAGSISAQPTYEATEEVTSTARPSLFSGTTSITATIGYGSDSGFNLVQQGQYDLVIVDQRARVAGTLPNIGFEIAHTYEVIIYEDLFTYEIRGFALEYPAP